MTTTSPNKLVQRRLNDFKRRCGEYGDAALKLAYHTALPVALNPELLHFLRINFFLEPPSPLPYTVEFEFLTSGLCREIDAELYEIEPEIRDVLLQGLSREYGLERIREVATLLWQYVKHHSPWADRVELERSQQLTVLNFLDPVKAKQWLDREETNASQAVGVQREWFIAIRQEIQQLPNLSRAIPARMKFDVFLSYSSENRSQVREIAQKLKNRGLKIWFDQEQIQPGTLWPDAIHQAIRQSKTLAVFIGKAGLGNLQTQELNILQYEDIRIIPVLLPGVDLIPKNLPFLGRGLTWVRFERGIDDTEALDRLESSITEQEPLQPSPLLLSRKQSKQLRKALLGAFPTHSALKKMVRSELNIRLQEIAAGENYSEVLFDLIEWTEAHGRLEELLIAAIRFNPDNSQLRNFYEQVLGTPIDPPKVFISYSWDSPEHMNRVLALSDRLRADGIDCNLDQYEVSPSEGWPRWMERQIREADFVLMICTETYLRRVEGEESPGKGHGGRWEGHLSYQDLSNAGTLNTKFIPVLLESGKFERIPKQLQGSIFYLAHNKEGYEALYYHLTNQPRMWKPELGKLKELPPRERQQDFSNQEPRLEPGTSKASVARKVFFSFHYQRDIWRVNVVRNCAISKGGYQEAGFWDHSLWETVKKEGELVIKRMINEALQETSVTIVLIGTETAGQRWVQYELEQSYERGNGMLGIYIHNIPNLKGQKDTKGTNPFSSIYTTSNGELVSLANLYPTYDWVADDGYNNFTKWVESAAKTARK